MSSNKYEEIKLLDLSRAKALLESSTQTEEIVHALLGVAQSDSDYQEIQNLLLQYIDHSDKWVAGAAISGLGDLARIQRKIDLSLVKEKLSTLQKSRPELEGKISDALSDFEVFLK